MSLPWIANFNAEISNRKSQIRTPKLAPRMTSDPPTTRWYSGITGYQWLVLTIASLGWIFDVFEGQVLLTSEKQMLTDLVPTATEGERDFFKYIALAAYLVGGAAGGVFFGALADRIGRVRTMTFTILMYSVFTCLTAFSQLWWHVVVLRFLVALGTGGEWAVASALVAEVFPPKARSWSGAIFHSSSTCGAGSGHLLSARCQHY